MGDGFERQNAPIELNRAAGEPRVDLRSRRPPAGCESASARDLKRAFAAECLSIAAINLAGVSNRKTCSIYPK
jgi:hypothetical protein